MIDRFASLRRRCGSRLIAALLAFGLVAAPGPVLAADTSHGPRALTLHYDVFVGGFYAFGFDATLAFDQASYAVALEGGTRGFIGQFLTWRMRMNSQGNGGPLIPVAAGLAPARFDNVSEWQGKLRRTSLRFLGGGRYAVEHDPLEQPGERDAEENVLPVSLPFGAMDPVAAAVAALAASAGDGGCERRVPVFDGRRRYDLIVHNEGGETSLMPSNFSAYAGPALSCRIGIKKISGFSARRNSGLWDEGSASPPVIWAAHLAPGMPMVPVRFMASINFGTMIVHLVHAEIRENGVSRTIVDLKR